MKVTLSLVLVLAATLVAYSPVLFSFFNGDDFVHLTWLKDAIANPALIWKNFHSSWLDGTTTRFYRPLISIFMVCDYLIWGVNGLGFRITNLLCHGVSTIFIFLIVSHLLRLLVDKKNPSQFSANRWALASAALFALYPLHPEAVSWITGRVDSVVTTFVLASVWCYVRWRTSALAMWSWLAAMFMVLGLLSKEMAITLPAVFTAYELCFSPRDACRAKPIKRIYHALQATWPFFALLGVYFVVRWVALGTFVGGYDDSLFFIQDWRGLLASWVHGLRMTIIPINKDFLGAHHLLTKLWELTLAVCLVLSVWCVTRHRMLIPVYGFATIWLIVCLIPVYKIFAIADDLQGSRLAYLATAPLCVLMTSGFALSSPVRSVRYGIQGLLVGLLCLAGILLWFNNQAWAEAGRQSNTIRAELSKLYDKLPGDPQVLIIGLPDHVHGAYVCRNALWGMTKKPQLQKSIFNCLMVNDYEPILPFGFLKESIERSADKIKLFRWAGPGLGLVPINLPASTTLPRKWTSPELAQVLQPIDKAGTQALWLSDGRLKLQGGAGFRRRPEVAINLSGQPCWSVDFISVTVELLGKTGNGSGLGADILYSNDLTPELDLRRRTHAQINAAPKEQTLIFALRSLPQWSLGGESRGLTMMLPDNCHLLIKSIELVPPQAIMPRLSFANSGYLGSKGFIHLSPHEVAQTITFDTSGVPGASAALLTITRPNLTFESQNPQQEGLLVGKSIHYSCTHGTMVLTREMFPATGIYEVRLWAADSQGRLIGVASDHIVVSVDS